MKSENEEFLIYKTDKDRKDEIAKPFHELTFDYICFSNVHTMMQDIVVSTGKDDPSTSTGQIQSSFLV